MPMCAAIREDGSGLPASIPLFPLAGALLLPRSDLPLNIFEPRYLAMLRDVMGRDRIIGMVQPRNDAGATPPVHDIGCAGRVTAFAETDDGRFLITLHGVARFRLVEELICTTAYRQAKVDYAAFEDDLGPGMQACGVARGALMEALGRYLRLHGLAVERAALDQAPDEILVNSLAMICPFAPVEKQALLEAETVADRAGKMIALMHFACAMPPDPAAGPARPN